ncbi:anti-sigma factor domain-containing protein [Flavobacterium sp. AG291]|uniref:anti-sigma factor n=1 Tax=Flavobacterium sp. AG291 TaxID=2184000 RepID=UPI000E0C3A48|nr:anti-sigma factor [Flavobacterium sp. AG291]RDI13180.1 anti-sigma-K factor rskA [Flavobacterium sp. AG291]
MEEFINSGILELYIFGVTTEEENREVQEMAGKHAEVRAEILSIEKAIIDLSYSVSPQLSPEVYHRIRRELIDKHGTEGVVQLQPRRSASSYIGWAAAIVLLGCLGVQYFMYDQEVEKKEAVTKERDKYEQLFASTTKDNEQKEKALRVIRAKNSAIVNLGGQQVSPDSYAKVYMNDADNEVFVDIAGLPEAPEGKEYQVWALTLNPLTPTSIGVLDKNKVADSQGIIQVDNFEGVQAFGITLEPTGGSATPTMEQLYTLGEVKS